jgi:hypothetical protein
MLIYHLHHKLADYDTWISKFKEGTLRKEVEDNLCITTDLVLHNVNDPNHAIVAMISGEDVTLDQMKLALDQITSDPRVQQQFRDDSLFSEPLQTVCAFEASTLEPLSEVERQIPAVFVDHQLADYDSWFEAWSANYDERLETCQKLGCTPHRLLRDVEDDNHVIVVFIAEDQTAVEQLLANPTAQETFADKNIFTQPPKIAGCFSPIHL